MKLHVIAAAFAALATASPLAAQAPVQAPPTRVLPAGTMIMLTPMQEIVSNQVRVGDRIPFTVVSDVIEQGQVVIPRGSPAIGIINFKTGKAIGGKSGKFEVTFESVTANGRIFLLTGKHRQEGKGNTVGALLGSILISGRSAVMQPGQIVTAIVKESAPY